MPWIVLPLALAGYLAGSVPFGVLVARFHGVDLLQVGSKSIGTSNVARALGARAAAIVFACDIAKGWIAAALLPGLFVPRPSLALRLAGGLAAVAGHCFPPWLGFRGGKGVATAAGALSVAAPEAALAATAVWVALAVATRIASVATLAAMGTFLLVAPTLDLVRGAGDLALRLWVYGALAAFLLWRHRDNLRRLAAGKELRLR